jgi:hypothetical protein
MCETNVMTQTRYQRWTLILGLIAMLGAVLAVPAAALAATAKAPSSETAVSSDMPCHKRLPDCPKPCPDLASCIVKCLKTQTPAPDAIELLVPCHQAPPAPAPQSLMEPTDLPRLLRPPIA